MIQFAGLEIELPANWLDITADLPTGSPPTLAREDGVGALQFSVYRYVAGEKPEIDEATLRHMFQQFCLRNRLQIEAEIVAGAKSLALGGVEPSHESIAAVWYLSDGASAGMVTYCAASSNSRQRAAELRDAEAVVRSARFPPTT